MSTIFDNQQKIDRPWAEYPIGTRAISVYGGFWEKTESDWKWCCGDTFPTPGGDAIAVILPINEENKNV